MLETRQKDWKEAFSVLSTCSLVRQTEKQNIIISQGNSGGCKGKDDVGE